MAKLDWIKNLNYVKYEDGGYALGEIDTKNNITGFGYVYYAKTQCFAMGKFLNSLNNGWICSNGDTDNNNNIYFSNWANGKMTEGISLCSSDKYLLIQQTNKKGEYEGYVFIIWPNGNWRYQYTDPSNITRGVECYEDGHIEMVYIQNNKTIWHKRILDNKLSGDYKVKFHKFTQTVYPNVEFDVVDKHSCIQSKADGPNINNTSSEFSIANSINGKYSGIIYIDFKDAVSIEQCKNGFQSGGYFSVTKQTHNWTYGYFQKDVELPVTVWCACSYGCILIRRANYDMDTLHDIILIDKDFNVRYCTLYDDKTNHYEDSYTYKYDDVFNSKDKVKEVKKPVSKVKTKRKSGSKKDSK